MKPTVRLLALFIAAAAIVAAPQSFSAEATGATIGYTCMGCHGAGGVSHGSIVSLAGRSADVMEQQLLAFKNDEREGTVMNRIAKGYTDGELKAVAQFFANLPAR